MVAEARSISNALTMAQFFSIRKATVVTDCENIMERVRGKGDGGTHMGDITHTCCLHRHIRKILADFDFSNIGHIKRVYDHQAHILIQLDITQNKGIS